MQKYLTDQELYNLLMESDIEEDEPDGFANNDDIDINGQTPNIIEVEVDDIVDEEPVSGELVAEGEEVLNPERLLALLEEKRALQFTTKQDIKWRRREFVSSKINFNVDDETSTAPRTPYEYFKEYFPDTFFESMAFETNLYATQCSKKFQPTNRSEMRQFVAIHIVMGVMKLPRLRLYWHPTMGIGFFQNAMSCDRFVQLRGNLHFCNNLEKPERSSDKFYKVRPLIECVRNRCLQLEAEEDVCVDEQIIPFKGRLQMKQYMKGKPNSWGIKVYVLCTKSGLPLDFFLYQGSSSGICQENVKKIGFGASVVLHLADRLKKAGHTLYCDNFFTNYPLLEILRSRNINATGTVRINRFAAPPLLTDKEMSKKPRGFSDSVVSRDGKITIVKWKDTKYVHLASNFVGIGQVDEPQRWDKSNKKYENVQRPEIVRVYNSGMGGVDLLDQYIAYYRIFIQSKKWTLRIFSHFIDFALAASWVEYRRDCDRALMDKNTQLDLMNFRLQVAHVLKSCGNPVVSNKRGRPSSSPSGQVQSTKRVNIERRPLSEIRRDMIDHLPQHDNKNNPTRCKEHQCSGRTHFMCEKCNVHLCITKDRNCFLKFHRKG